MIGGLTLVRNRGELAEGWYGVDTFQRAKAFAADSPLALDSHGKIKPPEEQQKESSIDSDEDMPGPALLGGTGSGKPRNHRSGPSIPNMQDLELQRGMKKAVGPAKLLTNFS